MDTRRRFIVVGVWAACLAALIFWFATRPFGPLYLLILLASTGLFAVYFLDRVIVYEACGFRCRGCGYELRGQVKPQCPECGVELTEDEVALLERIRTGATTPDDFRQRRRAFGWRGIIGVAILILLLTATLITGMLQFRHRRSVAPSGTGATGTTPAEIDAPPPTD